MEPQESPSTTEDGQSRGVVARISIPEQNLQVDSLLESMSMTKVSTVFRL